MPDIPNELERTFFSHREAEASLDAFVSARKSKENSLNLRDDLTLGQLVRNQHKIINNIFHDVRRDTFIPEPAIAVPVFAGKQRTIHKFPLLEQFLFVHFARCLSRQVEGLLPDSVFSFRPGRGNIDAVRRVAAFIKERPGPLYVLRRDIQNFGESLAHEHVLADFERFFPKAHRLKKLLEAFCRFELQTPEGIYRSSVGLPTGTYLQLIFENLYLLELDQALTLIPDAVHIRFGDDILFLSDQRQSFDSALDAANEIVARRKLIFNSQKSENILLLPSHLLSQARKEEQTLTPAHHFDYLGMRIFSNGKISLSLKKQRAIQSEMRTLIQSVARVSTEVCSAEELPGLLVQAVREFLSPGSRFQKSRTRNYLAVCSDGAQLGELDRWIALQILKVTTGKGIKKSNFKREAWKRLRALGLPSLVHQRRTND